MTRLLGFLAALLLTAALTGCGAEVRDPGADDPGESPSQTPSPSEDSGEVAFTEVALVSETAAGGRVTGDVVPLSTKGDVRRFVRLFEGDRLAEKVRTEVAATTVPEGQVLVGSVVALGCDVPPGVTVQDDGGLTVTAKKVASPLPECFAPVTTVALLLVDEELVPA